LEPTRPPWLEAKAEGITRHPSIPQVMQPRRGFASKSRPWAALEFDFADEAFINAGFDFRCS
jgi:hypothetical protein